jgi:(2Fe-2S) ferredoxin
MAETRYPGALVVQPVKLVPEVHLFVCANRREAGSPLGVGCSIDGDEVYDALKVGVARGGHIQSVWVTKTHCLGICPKHGATVAAYPKQRIWTEVSSSDAADILVETAPRSST